MKIFNLFNKRAARHIRDNVPTRLQSSLDARNTSKKIDAIESEMSAEFSTIFPATKPSVLPSASAAIDTSASTQIIEEATILHASDQSLAAENLLTSLIRKQTPAKPPQDRQQLPWAMLFDLFQIGGKQAQFEQLALDYATHFETSPPQWMPPVAQDSVLTDKPTYPLNFSGKLCANSAPLLDKLKTLGDQHQSLCMSFGTINEIDHAGCQILLTILQHWQARGRSLQLAGVDGLIEKIRQLIAPGRRDASDSAWLLLIELLRLTNNPAAHEEACVDYCITYEVSPPAFVAPTNKALAATSNSYAMPALVTSPVDGLLQAIAHHTAQQPRVVLDCCSLQRIAFSAAGPLLTGLLQLAHSKPVELRHTNFLVTGLLQLIGNTDKLVIFPRKL